MLFDEHNINSMYGDITYIPRVKKGKKKGGGGGGFATADL